MEANKVSEHTVPLLLVSFENEVTGKLQSGYSFQFLVSDDISDVTNLAKHFGKAERLGCSLPRLVEQLLKRPTRLDDRPPSRTKKFKA